MMDLKAFLDAKVFEYNKPEFIASDPIQVPHMFFRNEDIEIAAFLTATLAWGQRKTIIENSRKLMALMDDSPHDFITGASEKDYKRFDAFCHRTFNTTDLLYFLSSLRNIYLYHGGLGALFEEGFSKEQHAGKAIMHFRHVFFEMEFLQRTKKHVPNVLQGSAAKRLNMFIRWMVRKDNCGVDFGIWGNISPSWLSVPLDLHSGATARKLGLLTRKQDDWKAVDELTSRLREFDPDDPVKYDFALFGIGAFDKTSLSHGYAGSGF
jgi:uncharacterized protein (TIGR02757 family)